jgi:TetR/AcrR family transcriptional repressor of nem operon
VPEAESFGSRERLVFAAAGLFLAGSVEAVGVAEICGAARTNKGSFYHHFPSKTDLVVAVVDHHRERIWLLMDAAERRRRGPVNKLRSSADVVEEMQREWHEVYGRVVGCPFGNLAVELATTEERARRRVAEVFESWEQRLAEHCRAAAAQGRLRPGTDPDEFAHRVMAAMQGATLLAKSRGSDPDTIPEAMRRVIEAQIA